MDEIDRRFRTELRKHPEFNVIIERLKPGVYQLGTQRVDDEAGYQKVIVQLFNNKLRFRVGGGYVKFEDLIKEFGLVVSKSVASDVTSSRISKSVPKSKPHMSETKSEVAFDLKKLDDELSAIKYNNLYSKTP